MTKKNKKTKNHSDSSTLIHLEVFILSAEINQRLQLKKERKKEKEGHQQHPELF